MFCSERVQFLLCYDANGKFPALLNGVRQFSEEWFEEKFEESLCNVAATAGGLLLRVLHRLLPEPLQSSPPRRAALIQQAVNVALQLLLAETAVCRERGKRCGWALIRDGLLQEENA